MTRDKISIIGAGRVGSATAQLCIAHGLGDVVLVDKPAELAQGIALDLMQAAPLYRSDSKIRGTGEYADIAGSEIVCITAGAKREPGKSREELLIQNANIVKTVGEQVAKYAPESKLIVVTNPLDAMVYVAKKTTKFPRERVIGMAGILDSARFGAFIAQELKASVQEVSALVIGGHGDFMVPLANQSLVRNESLPKHLPIEKIEQLSERTRNAGAEILALQKQASAYYAPAASIYRMMEAILKDKKETLPCSVYLEGEYGVSGLCIGVPVVLGRNGVEKIVQLELTPEEKEDFQKSAEGIRALTCILDAGVCP